MFKVSRGQKSIKNRKEIDPKMKPKNDKEKYRKKSKSGAQKPPKMKSKIQKNPIKKKIGNMSNKGRGGTLGQVEIAHATLKGGTALEQR